MLRNLMCECFLLNCKTELLLRFKGEVICVPLVSPCFQTGFPNSPSIGQIALPQTYVIG